MDDLQISDYRSLNHFRHQIRLFLHFSEEAARQEGLEPQQHQMMLAIRAWNDESGAPTIGDLAGHLLLRHHSAVGLIDRLEQRGMVERVRRAEDRRQVRVHLTPEGLDKLRRLSSEHRKELRTAGPVLVKTLSDLLVGRNEDAHVA